MEKLFKKAVALILVVSIFIQGSIQSMAMESTNNSNLEKAVDKMEEMYPNSEIRVVNGEIHVAIESEDMPNISTYASRTAPNGGSYYNFIPPSYYTEGMVLPYSKVYLPKEQTQALYYAKLNSGLLERVSEQVQNQVSSTTIIQDIKQAYGVTLTATGVSFLAAFALIASLDYIDKVSFLNAYNKSTTNKLEITKTLLYGVPSTTYAAWDTTTVTDSPWQDFSPKWLGGKYIGFTHLS